MSPSLGKPVKLGVRSIHINTRCLTIKSLGKAVTTAETRMESQRGPGVILRTGTFDGSTAGSLLVVSYYCISLLDIHVR